MIVALTGLLAALNPAAAAAALRRDLRTDRPSAVAAGAALAGLVLLALGAAASPLLDSLDVSLGTYRLGTGVVVAVAGLRWLVAGPTVASIEPETTRGLAGFVAFPVLLTPGAAALAVSVAAEDGVLGLLPAVVVAVACGATGVHFRRRLPESLVGGLTRFLGALAVIVGVIVAVDGAQHL